MGFYEGVSAALEMFQEHGRELPSRFVFFLQTYKMGQLKLMSPLRNHSVAQTHVKLASQVAEFAPHIGDAMFEDLLPSVQTCRARHKMLTSHLGAHKALQPFPQLESTSNPPVSGVDPSLIQAAKAGSLTF
jgi:hypothetical protein